ncbi:Gfo/Idh/MocA family oxidoreductase [Marinomonas sp. TI.3.20]|uniref:Gfo/Idh/MocA family protein n=1 Tax=Marinomonas sp. TI.3.20 TaxID=3121296 RepID=UPI00311F9AB7
MQKKTLRVVTVGTGYFSQFHYNAWDRMHDVEIVALYNRSSAAATETAQRYSIANIYTDFIEMLDTEKPDLVDIITPPETHVAFVSAAIERGIPCICQKPFTPTFDDAKKLTEKIKQKQALVIIHENFRFQPWYQEIKKLLSSKQFENLYQVTFRMRPGDGQGKDAYLARQPYFQQMERFLIHETAIHWVDVFRYLLGDVKNVYADLVKRNPVIKGEDSGIVIFEFEKQIRAIFDGNRLADHAAENPRVTMGEMLIEGSKACLKLEGDGKISMRNQGDSHWTPHTYQYTTDNFGGDCVYALQRHVADHLLYHADLHNCAQQYIDNLKIEELIYRSAESKQRLDLR